MKDILKFLVETPEKLALLDKLDNIIKNESKESVENIRNSFKETMHRIIESGIKDIEFEKLLKEEKELLVDFISKINIKHLEAKEKPLAEQLEDTLNLYASKRRGEKVIQTFEELKQSFCECVKNIIKSGKIDFQIDKLPPFSAELFDKYTECKYIVTQADGNKQAFNTFSEMKESGVDFKDHQLIIKMKEAEKKIGNFSLYHQWWKGKHLENKSLDNFIIATDQNIDLFLGSNILNDDFKESIFYIKPSKYGVAKVNESTTFVAPKSELNITSMPAWLKIIDTGKISILESSELEKTIEFIGDKLKGLYSAKRENENSDFWVIHKESKHSHDKCMECSSPPKYEVKWAEGMGHAWFCREHFKSWSAEHKDDINYIKEVKNGIASNKFADNSNPNIKDKIFCN